MGEPFFPLFSSSSALAVYLLPENLRSRLQVVILICFRYVWEVPSATLWQPWSKFDCKRLENACMELNSSNCRCLDDLSCSPFCREALGTDAAGTEVPVWGIKRHQCSLWQWISNTILFTMFICKAVTKVVEGKEVETLYDSMKIKVW